MAHFAEINENNVVLRVLVVGDDQEHRGQEFLAEDLGLGGTWIQTSYNGNFRKHFAGTGFTYDPQRDAFIPPSPFPSWTLSEETLTWEPPVPHPDDGNPRVWDEDNQQWKPYASN